MRSSHIFYLRISAEFGKGTTTIGILVASSSLTVIFNIFFSFDSHAGFRIAFINHCWHACVYNGVLCTCEYNYHINESIAGMCLAASSSWLTRDKWLKIITHILSDENKRRLQLDASRWQSRNYTCIPKATREFMFAESRNRDECFGDRLPVVRVT